jgi:ABC-2 type transport system ATP-binding protein
MNAKPPIIVTNNLQRGFKDIEAVAGVSVTVQRGEIFGLPGLNGAGKTTTIRVLTGRINLSGGQAPIAGCDVVKEHTCLKELSGVVFEDQYFKIFCIH